jgi:hypothetical protein
MDTAESTVILVHTSEQTAHPQSRCKGRSRPNPYSFIQLKRDTRAMGPSWCAYLMTLSVVHYMAPTGRTISEK